MSGRLFVGGALLAFATPLAAQDVAIVNATVAIGDGSAPVEGATVVVRGGKVVAAGPGGCGDHRRDGQMGHAGHLRGNE
jgi:hypothetical protein